MWNKFGNIIVSGLCDTTTLYGPFPINDGELVDDSSFGEPMEVVEVSYYDFYCEHTVEIQLKTVEYSWKQQLKWNI